MSSVLDDIVESTASETGSLSNFSPALPAGDHVIVIRSVDCVDTRQHGKKVDLEMTVASSTSAAPGAHHNEPFFIGKPGDGGKYARLRLQALAKAVALSRGFAADDDAPAVNADGSKVLRRDGSQKTKGEVIVGQTLSAILDKRNPGRGVTLRVSTSPRKNKDKTKTYDNNTYAMITQTKEQIARARDALDKAPTPAPAPAAQQPAQQPAAAAEPQPVAAATQPAASSGGLLDDLI